MPSEGNQSGQRAVLQQRRRRRGRKRSVPAQMRWYYGGAASTKICNGNQNGESSACNKKRKRRRCRRANGGIRTQVYNSSDGVASAQKLANNCKSTVDGSKVSDTHGSHECESSTKKRRRGADRDSSDRVGNRRDGAASPKHIKRSRLDCNRDSVVSSDDDRSSSSDSKLRGGSTCTVASGSGRSLGMLTRESMRQFRQQLRHWEQLLVSFGEAVQENYRFEQFREEVKLYVSGKRKDSVNRVHDENSPDASRSLLIESFPDVIKLIATLQIGAHNLASKLASFQVTMSKANAFVDVSTDPGHRV